MDVIEEKPGRAMLVSFAAATLVALINTAVFSFDILANQRTPNLPVLLVWELTGAYMILPLLPLVYLYARRFPYEAHQRLKWFLAHLLGVMAFSILHTTLMYVSRLAIHRLLDWQEYQYGVLVYRYAMEMGKDVLVYWMLIGLLALLRITQSRRELQLKSATMANRLNEARLAALKMQLDPHFLFNTLNTVSAYMYQDVAAADKMIANLSRLLRLSLDHSDSHKVALVKELEFLDLYMNIMRARFGDKLQFKTHIKAAPESAAIPNLLLQPLIENAIKHNPQNDVCEVNLKIQQLDQQLHIEVWDNGPGFDGTLTEATAKGVGLSNTLARLEHLYGDQQQVELDTPEGGGFRLRIHIPMEEI